MKTTASLSNVLLGQLPMDERGRLLARGEWIKLQIRDALYDAAEPIRFVYFPRSGLYSVLALMDDGSAVEVASVGNDGLIGVPVALGVAASPRRCFCQILGEALRLDADVFREELRRPALQAIVGRYIDAFLVQTTQLTACNSVHSIQQRYARWILMTQDQLGLDQFALTQDFLAQMLGVRRASVNSAAATLQELGYIRYSRGRITVIDRRGVERAACECHRVIRTASENAFYPNAANEPTH